jgi:hypothetical protein
MAVNRYLTNIIPTSAPRLPSAPDQYSPHFQEQYSNVLRLYFNGVDTTFTGLLGEVNPSKGLHPGGSYLSFPYAACSRTTDATFTANTATLVTMNQNDFLNDCDNTGTNGIAVNTAGIYNYQFSVQFRNTDSQIHSAWIWLRVNGVDVPGTGSKFDVTGSHGGIDGFVIGAANFYVQLDAGQNVDMYAAVSNTAVTFRSEAVQTSPFPMPSIPSVVATLSFVSRPPSK